MVTYMSLLATIISTGGDGNDLGAYLGDNNNFWGGRGSDTFYATGISNIFTGGYGNDLGVLMGRSNMMFEAMEMTLLLSPVGSIMPMSI